MNNKLYEIGVKTLKTLENHGIWLEIRKKYEKENEILYSLSNMGIVYELTDEMKNIVNEIECSGSCKVIHVVSGKYKMSDDDIVEMDSYILVTREDEDRNLEINEFGINLYNYTFNKSWGEGEKGYGSFRPTVAGGLKRVA